MSATRARAGARDASRQAAAPAIPRARCSATSRRSSAVAPRASRSSSGSAARIRIGPTRKVPATQSGIDIASIRVPAFLPDTPEVRGDLADYFFEVQRFDREVGEILERLRTLGELDNTLVVITADNGMPFPRAKANVYDAGARLPFAMRWPGRARAGLVADAFISLSDLAPTFLEAAGLTPPDSMSARSLLGAGGRRRREQGRDKVFVERERHANVRKGDLSYPVRAVRTDEWLYIRNFRPDRWPAGDPEMYFSVGPYGDIDGGPVEVAAARDGGTIRRSHDSSSWLLPDGRPKSSTT